ncbi:hypothetical protein Tco_1436024 [Tanacetum coccineum]
MEVVMTKERISAALVIGTCCVDKGSAAHDVSHCEVNFQMQGTKTLGVSKFIDRDLPPEGSRPQWDHANLLRIIPILSDVPKG